MAAVALIDLTGAATIKGGFAQSPLLAPGGDVNMAILNLHLIGIVIFLLATMEAAESVVEVTKATESTTVSTTSAGGSESTPKTSTDPTQPSPTDRDASGSGSLENGGYPFATPGKRGGARHVIAHDGFHSLLNEKKWAHWNDAFTTPNP